ncbi:MAG: DUF2167 domain-containing protein [Alphaproteobacteria bacterium]|nr:DUF2167 domain-containing protein [Alphaproteobacteria bacterium]
MAERQKHTLKTAGAALALGVTFALASAQPPLAQQVPPSSMTHEAEQDLGARFGLTYRFGTFDIGSNLATVKTTEGFAFLDAADARHLIVDLWGNPPSAGSGILGAIVPKDVPVDDMNGWAAILTY